MRFHFQKLSKKIRKTKIKGIVHASLNLKEHKQERLLVLTSNKAIFC